MSKIHAGLSNQDILTGDPSSYHLVKVTTCAVSGQLATDACYHDAMNYGVVTDYWAEGTQPTVSCQMHVTQTVCADTGMIASEYCPNPVQQGIVTIPSGHPLYSLLGTQYQSVIEEYLGTAAANSNTVCTLHNAENRGATLSPATSQLISDAQQLLIAANNLLGGMDAGGGQYAAVTGAMAALRNIIDGNNPSQTEIASAMTALTQAMAGIY